MAADFGMEPNLLRLCVAQRHRISVSADTNRQALLAQISPVLLAWWRIKARLSNYFVYNSIIEPACKAAELVTYSCAITTDF